MKKQFMPTWLNILLILSLAPLRAVILTDKYIQHAGPINQIIKPETKQEIEQKIYSLMPNLSQTNKEKISQLISVVSINMFIGTPQITLHAFLNQIKPHYFCFKHFMDNLTFSESETVLCYPYLINAFQAILILLYDAYEPCCYHMFIQFAQEKFNQCPSKIRHEHKIFQALIDYFRFGHAMQTLESRSDKLQLGSACNQVHIDAF